MLHHEIDVNDGFGISKVVILMLQKTNMENCQKKIDLLKPGGTIDTKCYQKNWPIWTICSLKKGQNIERGNTK